MKAIYALALIVMFGQTSFAEKNCSDILKKMKNETPDFAPPPARRMASEEDKKERAKRIKQESDFLENQPILQQKALATALLNFLGDKAQHKTPDPTEVNNLMTYHLDATKVKANDPKNPTQQFVIKASDKDIENIRALSRYLLTAITIGTDAKAVEEFLADYVKHSDSFGRLLETCVPGDPTLRMLMAQVPDKKKS